MGSLLGNHGLPLGKMPRAQTSRNVTLNTTPVEHVQHFDSGKEIEKALKQVSSPKSSTSSLKDIYSDL